MSDRIGAAVARQHRVPRERLLLASSHTHSGPVVDTQLMVAYDVTPQQVRDVEAYTAALEAQIVDVVGQALQALAPATLHAGQTTATFAANRRVQYAPDGPVDHRVPMLRVDVGGKPRAILFSYACHNTTLPATNVEWHGDYAGVAQAAIEAAQPGLTALFMTGCGADANPKPRGTREDVQQHGEALAAAVRDGPADADARRRRRPARRWSWSTCRLPPRSRPTNGSSASGSPIPTSRGTRRLMDEIRARDGALPTSQKMPLQVWRFGDALTLVALGGEVVVDYALRLRRDHPDDHVWPVGYANDVFGYVPSRRVLDEGGYEGGGALLYYGRPGPVRRHRRGPDLRRPRTPDEEHTMTINRARRKFLGTVAAGGASLVAARQRRCGAAGRGTEGRAARRRRRPAVLGGTPVRTAAFPGWPVQDSREEQALVSVLEERQVGQGRRRAGQGVRDAVRARSPARSTAWPRPTARRRCSPRWRRWASAPATK